MSAETEPITDELAVAFLAAHALNSLEGEDHDTDHPSDSSCCPHSCAPCAALRHYLEQGRLTDVLLPYIQHGGGGWEWWDSVKQQFNTSFLLYHWCDPSYCPDANPGNEDER